MSLLSDELGELAKSPWLHRASGRAKLLACRDRAAEVEEELTKTKARLLAAIDIGEIMIGISGAIDNRMNLARELLRTGRQHGVPSEGTPIVRQMADLLRPYTNEEEQK